MNTLTPDYHYWIAKLGWTTGEMLTLLTRGVPPRELPGGRDRPLEAYLAKEVKARRLIRQPLQRKRVYALKGTKVRNLFHDLMAAQSIVRLYLAFKKYPSTLYSPGDFFTQVSPVIPDFGLTISFPNGLHGFALEYQTILEARRTTKAKLTEYWVNFEKIRSVLKSEFVWVVFVLDRSDLWARELAKETAIPFAYMVSAGTFFATADLTTAAIFFNSSGEPVRLADAYDP